MISKFLLSIVFLFTVCNENVFCIATDKRFSSEGSAVSGFLQSQSSVINFGYAAQRMLISMNDQRRINKFINSSVFAAVTTTNMNVTVGQNLPDIPVTIYLPNSYIENSSIIVFCHGGSFIFGTRRTYHPAITHLAFLTGAAIVSVEYRLAPENKFPIGLDDCKLVTDYIVSNKALISPLAINAPIGVMGDSAGGNLAGVTANELTSDKLAFQILIYALGDLQANSTPSKQEFKTSQYIITPASFSYIRSNYLVNSKVGVSSPRLNITAGVTSKTPKTLLIAAQLDPLRDDSINLKAILDNLNVSSELYIIDGMGHGFFENLDLCPNAFSQVANYVSSFLSRL